MDLKIARPFAMSLLAALCTACGGGGGDNGAYAPGGGGGSGYLHSSITNGTTTTGSGSTPAQSGSSIRGTAGNPRTTAQGAGAGNDGLFYLTT